MLCRQFALGYHGSTANYNCDIKEFAHMESGTRKIFICCLFDNDGAIMLPGTLCCCPFEKDVAAATQKATCFPQKEAESSKPEVFCIHGQCLGSSTEIFTIRPYRLKCSDLFGNSSDYYIISIQGILSRRLDLFHQSYFILFCISCNKSNWQIIDN